MADLLHNDEVELFKTISVMEHFQHILQTWAKYEQFNKMGLTWIAKDQEY